MAKSANQRPYIHNRIIKRDHSSMSTNLTKNLTFRYRQIIQHNRRFYSCNTNRLIAKLILASDQEWIPFCEPVFRRRHSSFLEFSSTLVHFAYWFSLLDALKTQVNSIVVIHLKPGK